VTEPSTHPAISLLVPKVESDWLSLNQDMEDLTASVERCDDHAALKMVREILTDRGIPCYLPTRSAEHPDQPRLELLPVLPAASA
jgi:hypothetical protein